jgi:hypothetical protein
MGSDMVGVVSCRTVRGVVQVGFRDARQSSVCCWSVLPASNRFRIAHVPAPVPTSDPHRNASDTRILLLIVDGENPVRFELCEILPLKGL